jgi:molecular chaperone GrpE (heat shock protein)
MRDPIEVNLSKWPFVCGDLLLVGAAGFIYRQSTLPMGPWQIAFVVLCVAGGAWLGIMPFLLEYRTLVKLAEARGLTTVVAQMQNLETIAGQIAGATGRWQNAQEEAEKVASAAKAISERMALELKAFTDFMHRASEGERATLRLEVEKLRRSEADWLQLSVRLLDHVYALHMGGVRSGQPNLIEQLSNFQNACRDAARRVGLTPFTAEPAETFDSQRHQLLDAQAPPTAGATISETVATGYTFQGRLLRPALVRLSDHDGAVNPTPVPTQPAELPQTQSQPPLGADPAGPSS